MMFWSNQAFALDITSVRFGTHPDKIRIVIDMSETSDFRVFALSSPYRLVVDLPSFKWSAPKPANPATVFISDIRQGQLMDGLSRIVFDLKHPVIAQSAFMLPPNKEHSSDRLVIDYKIVETPEFEKNKGNVLGTLQVNNHPNVQNSPVPPSNSMRPNKKLDESVIKKPIIIIDPGHGGVDPGAIGQNKVYEKNVVLKIARELRNELLSTGRYRVFMTRDKDVFVKLKDRVKFARKHNGDLFISLHADSIKKKNVRGTSIYTISKKASDAQTAALAKKENQADLIGGVDLNIEDKQVAFILGDFLVNDTMNQSKFFANTIVDTLGKNGIRKLDNTHRYAGFAVLKAPDIPSVLIETGFMSNYHEAKMLNQKSHQKNLAKAIRYGVDEYFKHVALNENN